MTATEPFAGFRTVGAPVYNDPNHTERRRLRPPGPPAIGAWEAAASTKLPEGRRAISMIAATGDRDLQAALRGAFVLVTGSHRG